MTALRRASEPQPLTWSLPQIEFAATAGSAGSALLARPPITLQAAVKGVRTMSRALRRRVDLPGTSGRHSVGRAIAEYVGLGQAPVCRLDAFGGVWAAQATGCGGDREPQAGASWASPGAGRRACPRPSRRPPRWRCGRVPGAGAPSPAATPGRPLRQPPPRRGSGPPRAGVHAEHDQPPRHGLEHRPVHRAVGERRGRLDPGQGAGLELVDDDAVRVRQARQRRSIAVAPARSSPVRGSCACRQPGRVPA